MVGKIDREQVRYGLGYIAGKYQLGTEGSMDEAAANCGYCAGYRDPNCTCATDCGARQDDHGHVCGHAPPEVIAEWLRSTGLYSEEEIARYSRRDDHHG
jgi:hypothetical protein